MLTTIIQCFLGAVAGYALIVAVVVLFASAATVVRWLEKNGII